MDLDESLLPWISERAFNEERKASFKWACPDRWTWDNNAKSDAVILQGEHGLTAYFHPTWSNGTAGVRGTRPLSADFHFWEIHISNRVFGTSMMIGVGTKSARLHADSFINLLGEDENSWALSHRGFLYHRGKCRPYTIPFTENSATTIGVLLDRKQGTLSFFKDGLPLGIAFTGLDHVTDPLYPVLSSTSAKTLMTVGTAIRPFTDLQDRCRAVVTSALRDEHDIESLPFPNRLKTYMKEFYAWDSCEVTGRPRWTPSQVSMWDVVRKTDVQTQWVDELIKPVF